MTLRRDAAVWLLAGWLVVMAVAMFGLGLFEAWKHDSFNDMDERLVEYTGFRAGVYPNRSIDTLVEGVPYRYSVYPPYAIPMFAVFFEPGGRVQGRILIELLSAVALAVLGFWGWSRLGTHGAAWGAVGAVAAAGVPAIKSVIAIGQFSTICVGCIALQIAFLARNQPLAAGACWAAAMIKPQIGLAFAALFLVNRAWRGLLLGVAILVGLSLFALWWTDVSPAALAHHWLFKMPMSFTVDSAGFGPAAIAHALEWDHRVVQYATLAVVGGALAVTAAHFAARDLRLTDYLPMAAVCAALGRVLLYHRSYDQIMLFPLLLACLDRALAAPRWGSIVLATAVAATLWIPHPLMYRVPGNEFFQPAVWVLAALAVGLAATRPGADAQAAS